MTTTTMMKGITKRCATFPLDTKMMVSNATSVVMSLSHFNLTIL